MHFLILASMHFLVLAGISNFEIVTCYKKLSVRTMPGKLFKYDNM